MGLNGIMCMHCVRRGDQEQSPSLALTMHNSQQDCGMPQRSYVLPVRVCVMVHCDSVCVLRNCNLL
jgi:hypothetical protein